MNGKRVLITGANSGIGFVTALRLAEMGAEIIMVCRDQRRGEIARSQVQQLARGPSPRLHVADLSQRKAIRELAADCLARYDRLDVLINNAGAVFGKRELSADGHEMTFATNHLAPFALTLGLLPLLKAAPRSRIITVASRVHAGKLDFDNLQGEKRYSAMTAYGQSKLENILFSYELARRLSDQDITVNCLAPGLVASNFGRNAGGLVGLMPRLLALTSFSVSPEEGAKTSIFLASSSTVEVVSGRYFYRCKEARSKPISYNLDVAKRLWSYSETTSETRLEQAWA